MTCVILKGEKGKNGGGDAGDATLCGDGVKVNAMVQPGVSGGTIKITYEAPYTIVTDPGKPSADGKPGALGALVTCKTAAEGCTIVPHHPPVVDGPGWGLAISFVAPFFIIILLMGFALRKAKGRKSQ